MKIYLAEWSDGVEINDCIGIYSSLKKAKQALRENTEPEDYKTITKQIIDPKDILDDRGVVVWHVDPWEEY